MPEVIVKADDKGRAYIEVNSFIFKDNVENFHLIRMFEDMIANGVKAQRVNVDVTGRQFTLKLSPLPVLSTDTPKVYTAKTDTLNGFNYSIVLYDTEGKEVIRSSASHPECPMIFNYHGYQYFTPCRGAEVYHKLMSELKRPL